LRYIAASLSSYSAIAMHAMILAAGRGERLRPLTDHLPKPLIEVGGKPLIGHHLERLAAAGFKQVVINLGWLGDKLPQMLGDGERWGLTIRYSQEPPGALETAGGIRHALELLGPDPFLVIAGDILCDFPLATLRGHQPPGLAHLIMVDNPPHHPDGDFGLAGDRIEASAQARLTFSGIAVYRPELFADLPPGRYPLRPVFEQAIAARQVSGQLHSGYWSDVGTAERLAATRALFG
jgi:N-acetyl-alpha-D-muramate 1-phosphate uridylyltransferase